jgi:Lipocalin-like domain
VKRLILPFITASALIFGVFLPREEAVAQTPKDLVGTWTLVSITLDQDGKKTDMYGPSPQGQQILDPSGRYSLVIMHSDLTKFASNNRQAGTPEENKAVVQGSIAFFGTYTVDDAAKTLTQHVDSCTFPNWNGSDRKLSFTISGDELHLTTISKASTGTGTADLVWKRAK